ncbi:MAG: hypothetical protein A2821_00125 [Candidatus Magasanikbacteria bacterium RIFCSPHIGHO2_01_FULL_41_23]|uniref:Translin n=1 Tax=Candidatus Magasanikbacteria bacterium RIFCSPLOWO2_01_FULL_40_15 TaxID=1798686 RepID=A0A1F6N3X3_9BACT|nr:MAG: hypothetical protein A2821_00125 [Candidatus Magasanikbacteria bacterium RIFCSPHIGHO2_01_FULL_41_23]OGH78574.1 MAG: hypothetical protein A2983_02845 [Candidatus Magasanikbacteria bacterium RIFCSPLOWO2_01_FULL_40_15]
MTNIKNNLNVYSEDRRDVIKLAGDALHSAKRCIFALQRDNMEEANEKLAVVEKIFGEINFKHKKNPALLSEGAYEAALEEYVEACLFFSFVTKRKIIFVSKIKMSDNSFIAGLCDVPGELYRYALKAATKRNFKTVAECAAAAEEIIGSLIEFDLTSYLRTKFDQAKQAGQKLEQVVYEVSLRQ